MKLRLLQIYVISEYAATPPRRCLGIRRHAEAGLQLRRGLIPTTSCDLCRWSTIRQRSLLAKSVLVERGEANARLATQAGILLFTLQPASLSPTTLSLCQACRLKSLPRRSPKKGSGFQPPHIVRRAFNREGGEGGRENAERKMQTRMLKFTDTFEVPLPQCDFLFHNSLDTSTRYLSSNSGICNLSAPAPNQTNPGRLHAKALKLKVRHDQIHGCGLLTHLGSSEKECG